MKRKISITTKDEAYSYDELQLLEEKVLPLVKDSGQQNFLAQIFVSLKNKIEKHKDSMAIFFMPQNAFNIFSLFQGDNSICNIQKENIEALITAFDLIEAKNQDKVYSNIYKKIKVLNDYLQQGNSVSPIDIQMDSFSLLEVE